MAKEKQVSERVAYTESSEAAVLTMNGKVERWKITALSTWLFAWLVIGAIVLREMFIATERDLKLTLFIFLAFWAYYLWRIGKVWLYRRAGYERVRISHGEIQMERNIVGKGKIARYFIENIETLKQIEVPEKSLAFTYENLWWVLGGEKVGFDYGDKFVRFGMQLSEKETKEVLRFLQRNLVKHRGNRG